MNAYARKSYWKDASTLFLRLFVDLGSCSASLSEFLFVVCGDFDGGAGRELVVLFC